MNTDAARPRVLLVDSDALFRRGLRRLLEQHDVDVIGEGSHGRCAVQLASELRHDVAIVDLSVPFMSGLEAIQRIVAANPAARILAMTSTADETEVLDALLAGACGYLPKDAHNDDIVAGVRAAMAGEAMISPRIAARLVTRLREAGRPAPPPQLDACLTRREVEILKLVTSGKQNSAIAEQLFLSPKTVKNHVAAIIDKLGLENRVQAAVVAVRSGLA